jgi:NADH:ubiquinone oxidoreductase subunit K
MTVPITGYLAVSAILFAIGGYGLITKRNAMRLVFSIEILIGAANLNFIAFNRFFWPSAVGQTFVLFSIALGASEAAVILAIVVVAFRLRRDIDVSKLKELEG